ncbi:hypothetical protein SCMC78_73820 (plasmid) [Streptomyces sp. CMC78]|nr:hypothetical protein [Streptomyces sp. DE06-01C]MDX5526255.1 hypothetical protein [Streptomyces sp. DE06-01C]
MTRRETPRAPDGAKLCGWCGGPIQQSGVGRSRDYCSRTHREYAYRDRREAEIRIAAYSRGRADAQTISTTDESRAAVSPVDETAGPQVAAPEAPAVPDAWRAAAPAVRRPLSRRRSGMTADAIPLWREE